MVGTIHGDALIRVGRNDDARDDRPPAVGAINFDLPCDAKALDAIDSMPCDGYPADDQPFSHLVLIFCPPEV